MNDILLLNLAAANIFTCSPFNVNCTFSGWRDSFLYVLVFLTKSRVIHFNKAHLMLKSVHDVCAFKSVEKDLREKNKYRSW